MRVCSRILFLFFLILSLKAVCKDNTNVLLLNSYHKGFEWTDNITRGIEDALKDTTVELHVEYMDTKRYFDSTYQHLLLKLLHHKHKTNNYKLILTSDNNAFNFIQKYRDSIYGNIPVVFTGLNYVQKNELLGFTNYTGINEKANIKDNILLIKNLHPYCDSIYIIVDNTTTGKRLQNEVNIIKNQMPDINIGIMTDLTIDELVYKLNNVGNNNIVLFTLFFRDKNNQFLEYDDGAQLVCKSTSVPVYGTWTFSLGHGIIGGFLTDGHEQGLLAGKKALEILNGIPANKIPIEMDPPSKPLFDYNQLNKYKIDIKKLPANSTIKFRPPGFYEKNKNLIRNLLFIIGFLFSTIFILLYAMRIINNARKQHLNSKAQLKTIIDSIPSLVFVNNAEGKFLLANKAVSELFTPQIKNIEGKYIFDLYRDEKIIKRIKKQNTKVLSYPDKKHLYENYYPDTNGKNRWFRTIKIACPQELFGEPAILAASLDVTQIKDTEQALKHAKKFAENLLETANTLIIGLDTNANIRTFNRFAEELTGYKKAEVMGKNWFDIFIQSDQKDRIPKVFTNVLREMPAVSQYENEIITKNGNIQLINWNNSVIKNDQNEITGILSIGVDITERNKAENEIKKSENKFKSIFDNSPLGILYYNYKGIILDCNETFVSIIGSTKEKLLGINMLKQLPDQKLVRELENSLNEGLGIYEDYYKSITADKTTPVKGTFKGIKDSSGKITGGIGIIEDITHHKNAENKILAANEKLKTTNDELVTTTNALTKSNLELSEALIEAKKSKELELANKLLTKQAEELNLTINKLKETQTQLIQAEKLASIGVLTSGIAHEINNPLNFIQGGKTAIELHLFDNLPEQQHHFAPFIEMIDTGIQRATNIVQSLSHFNRKTDSYDEVLFLHKIIDNCLTMLENRIKYKVDIKKDYTTRAFTLKGNEGKMHQVFLNVLANAEQAIKDNGEIFIKTTLKSNDILVHITDTGCGIKKDDIQKIGEPFFTTKKAGEGTGLGLSITKNIIKDHNGSFKIESELNHGTTITIKLPVNK